MPEQEVLLRVEHLCQYFKSNKAVDDVTFDIKKGEVFGLVGESGCGKTTTGRSIIKLYDITSGNIYFKGKRVAAGTASYKKAIAKAREEMKTADPARKDELKRLIADQRAQMKAAIHDHKNCDKMYAGLMVEDVEKKYQPLLAAATGDELEKLKKKYAYEKRIAKKQRFITQIQMIFQDPIASLDPRMTVYETIAEGLVIRGEKDKEVIDEKVYKVLELVGLVREHASRYPHEFSGGQRQRIGVARAVVMNPELIIADEPVSALDVSIQAQVINLLNELRHKLGLTILFIAHDLSVVKYFSDRIGVMYFGKLVELATSDELFANPLHPYTQSLLSAIPLPDPHFEKQRQRIKYDPLKAHDYSTQQPTLREVAPGHFVQCNDAEFEQYQKQLAK
ncbi:MAG: ATP-binding cassette domain-containing protein [Clostridia bacterium]|nr:ATP-binding cassette domain-containing protein [Clostridia bacterium]